MKELAAVFAGGAAGALARTGLAEAVTSPWATLLANVAGCLVLGAVLVRTEDGGARRGLLGAGFCGGLTTFSTFQLELLDLLRDGDVALAAVLAAASLALGSAALEVGRRL